ncbi:MAG: hypothetical protein AB1511_14955 [Deinococcota bacterium]
MTGGLGLNWQRRVGIAHSVVAALPNLLLALVVPLGSFAQGPSFCQIP